MFSVDEELKSVCEFLVEIRVRNAQLATKIETYETERLQFNVLLEKLRIENTDLKEKVLFGFEYI